MNHKLCIKLVGCLILASLLAACSPREVVKEVEVEVTRVVEEEVVKEVEVEVTRVVKEESPVRLSLSTLAQQIRAGEIDVGEEYGMAPDQRFHQIHATAIEMECAQCHVEEAPLEVAATSVGAPGPVDRRVCVGCHLTAPASKFYEPKE